MLPKRMQYLDPAASVVEPRLLRDSLGIVDVVQKNIVEQKTLTNLRKGVLKEKGHVCVADSCKHT